MPETVICVLANVSVHIEHAYGLCPKDKAV